MNETRIPGIWKGTVVLLIACNMGLMLTIWLKPQQQPRGDEHRGGGRARDYVIAQLKFTDEQVAKYDALIKDHRASMEELRAESMELRSLLFHNMKKAPGGLNADSVAQLIADKQQQVEIVTYKHFVQVRTEVCTETQKPELDKIIDDVLKHMNGGMRGGTGPRGGDGPEGHERRPNDGNEPPPEDQ